MINAQFPAEKPFLREKNAILKEDLTGENLATVMHRLNQLVSNGNLLHGTRRLNLSELTPQTSINFFYNNGEPITGVFATDQAHLALARAAYGDRLYIWTKYFVFGVKDNGEPDPEPGVIYIFPEDQNFSNLTYDPSEQVSGEPIIPTRIILISPQLIAHHIRTKSEVDQVLDLETLEIKSEGVNSHDLELILLIIKNFLDRIGIIEDYPSQLQFDLLIRLQNMFNNLHPIISKLPDLMTDLQKNAAAILCQQYFDTWDPEHTLSMFDPLNDTDDTITYFLDALRRGS